MNEKIFRDFQLQLDYCSPYSIYVWNENTFQYVGSHNSLTRLINLIFGCTIVNMFEKLKVTYRYDCIEHDIFTYEREKVVFSHDTTYYNYDSIKRLIGWYTYEII